jgi:hypothetical protein
VSAAGSTRTGGTRRLLWWGLPALVVVLLVVGYLVWPRTDPGRVLWVGSFDAGAIPPGRNGSDCHTGRDVPTPPRTRGYDSIQEQGNTDCSSDVSVTGSRVRTKDSARSLRIEMGPHQQRELAQSTYAWTPDDHGSVDQWYGVSLYYASDWNEGGGLQDEVSASEWHTPVAWRMDGDNGSLNISGDLNLDNADGKSYKSFDTPHLVLRRNTLQNRRGLYKDGRGLDKLDLGPLVVGRWIDLVCHIRWSTTSTNALRECWRDGKYRGKQTSRNAVAAKRHYLRVGLYQTTDIDHHRTLYVDNVRIGTGYQAVDPARTR